MRVWGTRERRRTRRMGQRQTVCSVHEAGNHRRLIDFCRSTLGLGVVKKETKKDNPGFRV